MAAPRRVPTARSRKLVTTKVTADELERWRTAAGRRGVNLSELVRQAVEADLATDPEESPLMSA